MQRLNRLSRSKQLFSVLEKKENRGNCCDFKVDKTQLAPHEEVHAQICSLPGIKYESARPLSESCVPLFKR